MVGGRSGVPKISDVARVRSSEAKVERIKVRKGECQSSVVEVVLESVEASRHEHN